MVMCFTDYEVLIGLFSEAGWYFMIAEDRGTYKVFYGKSAGIWPLAMGCEG